MGKEFLYQVAKLFWEKEGDSVSECRFVFPNRRSSLFFQKYLGQISAKPVFSPDLITINTLFQEISGLRIADKTSSLFNLYSEYTLHRENEAVESFDDFLFWGDTILNDFDDVDKYLIDAEKLFANIQDLHQLDSGYEFLSPTQKAAIEEFWGHFIPFSQQAKEQSFLSIWNHLFEIYTGFRESLLCRGEGYEGMIYRAVAERVKSMEEVPEPLKKYKKIIFVGLNALNKCEKTLLSFLKKEGVADFYWDYYGSVIKDKQNKSSLFMEDNIVRYPSRYKIEDDISGDERPVPQIDVIGVPSMVGQAKSVYDILDRLLSDSEEEAFSTSVVLPDENLLLPVLNSIPEKIRKVNVTMGYSLVHNQVASFMDSIALLQGKTRLSGATVSFYHTVVTDILSHPYIAAIAGKCASAIKKEIVSQNMVFVAADKLKGEPILKLIFTPLSNIALDKSERVRCVADYQLSILLELQKHVPAIDKEFVFAYYKCINRLKGLNLPIEVDTYYKLLHQLVSSISIPFKGEPLSGLQIMGPLETRALDFDNVIILSVNEGTFPSRGVSTSFIPYNLRKGFDLPNYEFQDSISAYHFYRSIYRAKRVFLLYDTRTEGVGRSGEASRFVKQLKYHHKVALNEHLRTYKIISSPKKSIEVAKTSEMISLLENKYMAATTLNAYISCSLKFYFQVIEGIKEEEDVTDDVESAMFGKLFHKVMENLYSKYVGKVVSKDALLEEIADEDSLKKLIFNAFVEEMKISSVEGKNKIIEALLVRYVKKTLETDMRRTPFTFLSKEQKCHSKFELPSGRLVNLFGIIDRVESSEGNVRIIDYKTGGFDIDYKSIGDIFDSSSGKRPDTALQMLFYLYLLERGGKIDSIENVQMSICSVKELFKSITPGFIVTKEEYSEFKDSLSALLEEIFDISHSFKATDNLDECGYCQFKILCNR